MTLVAKLESLRIANKVIHDYLYLPDDGLEGVYERAQTEEFKPLKRG
jgi:hypothetical protein